MNLERMKREHGSFLYEGKEYVLIDEAFIDDAEYKARVLCAEEKPDEDGVYRLYMAYWDIRPEYDPDFMQEDMACEWENPRELRDKGECYQPETGYVC